MKLLLDACVWPRAADELRKQGHDVVLVSQQDKAMSDNEVLEWALKEGRTIITRIRTLVNSQSFTENVTAVLLGLLIYIQVAKRVRLWMQFSHTAVILW